MGPNNIEANFLSCRYYYERGFASEVISFLDVAQSICNQIKLIPETFEKHAAELLRGQIDIDLTLYCIATSVKDPKTALLHAMRYNEICVSDLSEQDITISKSWNELGVGYMMNLMYSEAIESFSTSLFTLENIKGGYESTQSPYLPMVNLGYAYLAKGKVEEAAAIIKDSLELRQSKYGWDDTRNFVFVILSARFERG